MSDHLDPATLHAVVVRSPYAHARVTGADIDEATSTDGVRLVWLAGDVPTSSLPDGQSLLASDKVSFLGQPVAIVVASTRSIAEDAADLVFVDYEDEPPVLDAAEVAASGSVLARSEMAWGDPGPNSDDGCVVVSGRFQAARVSATPLGLRTCLAVPGSDGAMTVSSPTEAPEALAEALAAVLGTDPASITVTASALHGSAGQKAVVAPEVVLTALAARHLGVPVSWLEDRRENLLAAPHDHGEATMVELVIGPDGSIVRASLDTIIDAGASSVPRVDLSGTGPSLAAVAATGQINRAEVATNKTWVVPRRAGEVMVEHVALAVLAGVAGRQAGMAGAELYRRAFAASGSTGSSGSTGLITVLDAVGTSTGTSVSTEAGLAGASGSVLTGVGLSVVAAGVAGEGPVAAEAVVAIDPGSGIIRLQRCTVAVSGRGDSLPAVREAVVQGVGHALLEALVYDENGQLLTTTFMDYLVPTASEIPAIDIVNVHGEPSAARSIASAIAAAIVDAANDAIGGDGAPLRELPLTPPAVADACSALSDPLTTSNPIL